ncbi:hypothetical protein [Robiginitalea sp. IMCC43444]|uniref:hypothetical protein n=1 Tax=Robiginitalea sp. IMCC43444 TaxID=3459121 RepID=UPI0040413C84
MAPNRELSRRIMLKSSAFGLLAVSIPALISAGKGTASKLPETLPPEVFHRYPAIDDAIVAEVVGASHFNLDRVKELVSVRPELARATWDWGFGDWETALGAASHVGRRDIALYLIENGARPDIFTYAMLGDLKAVQAMIKGLPGVQAIYGPHGISLLSHAKAGLRSAEGNNQKQASEQLIAYLEERGDANPAMEHLPLDEAAKEAYLGDYKYGEGAADGFSVRLNMRKFLSFGPLGKFGGALYRQPSGVFFYNGVKSVQIRFNELENQIVSLTVTEPGLEIKAQKVSS